MSTIVVGNGGSLLDREMGNLIDSYDTVVRINRCKTDGFEKHVGSKTDIWVVSVHGALGRFKWPNKAPQPEAILCYPKSSREFVLKNEKKFVNSVELMPFSVADDVDGLTGGYYPSTGILAVWMFRPCAVIGFDHFVGKNHYCDELQSPNSHKPKEEADFFKWAESIDMIKRL